jgi:holo-[acyl-carrier protein] synthase
MVSVKTQPKPVLGIGIDMTPIDRLAKIIRRTPRFAERVFTPGERAYCQARARPEEHYAARFAAKEAFLKAVGSGLSQGVRLAEIEVVRENRGAPALKLGPSATRALERIGCSSALLSLSHAGNMAVALVVVQ